eukprot:15276802-Ditylum_brightwellii.AAC.1
MVTFSTPIIRDNPQDNCSQELKLTIPFKRDDPWELVNEKYHTHNLHMVPYNANLPTYNLVVLYFDVGTIKEWLKFWQNLEIVITGQNIADAQGWLNFCLRMTGLPKKH